MCETLFYIFSVSDYDTHYLRLTGGKSIEDALVEMLSADDVNQTNSTIKTVVDNWYKLNMTKYTSYLEDTIFCNGRSIYSFGGWSPNGGFSNLLFNNSLICSNITDQFSMSNEKAKLIYPVGLMSSPEMNLLNNNNARTTDSEYWLLSPSYYSVAGGAFEQTVSASGYSSQTYVTYSLGIRPAISLKANTEYISGDGSTESPYYVPTD